MKPAVPIDQSVTPDYIVCLEDGVRLKVLKHHLLGKYGLTLDQYRKRWGLPDDYPTVASNYAREREEMAKRMGISEFKNWE